MKDEKNKNNENNENENNEEIKKHQRVFNRINWGVIILLIILLVIQFISWIETIIVNKSTLSFFGYRAYISTYSSYEQDIDEKDFVLAKKLKKSENYEDLSEIVYKVYNKKHISVILEKEKYNVLKNSENISGKIKCINKKLGKIITFVKEPIIIICVAIFIIALIIASNLAVAMKKKNKLPKKYLRVKRAKEIFICAFAIATYITIFLIGELVPYNSVEKMLEKDIEGNNNVDEQNVIKNDDNNNEIANNDNEIPNDDGINSGETIDTNIVFIVKDNKKTWNQSNEIDMFNNKFFRTNKMAPGVYGSYSFDVKNDSTFDLVYNMSFEEINSSGINLKYKIIKNGQYLNDEYEDISNLSNIDLAVSKTDTYVIEWKWIDNYNDTEIGENAENVKYILNIKIIATQK